MKEVYGVYPHSERQKETGRGFVVREATETDGFPCEHEPIDYFNYGGIRAVAFYCYEKIAQKVADRYNAERS